jgi:hypothetical protein
MDQPRLEIVAVFGDTFAVIVGLSTAFAGTAPKANAHEILIGDDY